jgi:hypothetical protein
MRDDDGQRAGPIRRALLRLEPWLLGALVLLPFLPTAVELLWRR